MPDVDGTMRCMAHGGPARAMSIAAIATGALALTAPGAPAAGWTTPSVLVDGDEAALLALTARPDAPLRAAVADTRSGLGLGLADRAEPSRGFTDPLLVLRQPPFVSGVAFAADGGGVALQTARGRDQPTSVVAFDAAGVAQPPAALGVTGDWATTAVAPDGAAVVAWAAEGPKGYEIDAAFRDPGSAAFGAPVRAGYTTTGDTLVHAGIGDDGEAVVIWQGNNFPSAVAGAGRRRGQRFPPPRFVSRSATDARLAVGPGGQAVIAASAGRRLEVAVKAPGAATLPAMRTLDRAISGFALDVTAAGPRQVGIACLAAPDRRGRVRVRVYAGAGGPRRIGTVATSAGGEDVRMAVSPAGSAVVAWQEELRAKRGDPTARAHLGVAYRPAGGRFGRPTWMGPVSLDDAPQPALIGPGGRAAVAYEAFQSGDRAEDSYRRVYVAERRP